MIRTKQAHDVHAAPGDAIEAEPLAHLSLEDVEYEPVSSHGWRVVDRRLPRGVPFRTLAFIERLDGRFEVLQLDAGFEWHCFDTVEAAVAHAVGTSVRRMQRRRSDRSGPLAVSTVVGPRPATSSRAGPGRRDPAAARPAAVAARRSCGVPDGRR